jgi:WD repeat-containing protein 35
MYNLCYFFQLSEAEAKKKSQPLRVKKLYVLSALLVEEHQQHIRQQVQGSAGEVTLLLEWNMWYSSTPLCY